MVGDLDGDAAGRGLGERARGAAVERGPGLFVDFGLERGFERFVRVVNAQDTGATHETALLPSIFWM